MNTPNNAAALERLEQKWREEAAAEWTHCQNKELSEWVRDRCYGQHNRLLSCADELATLRATLAQPDALTSQPSGEAVAWQQRIGNDWPGAPFEWHEITRQQYEDRRLNPSFRDYEFRALYTHPSADAPGAAVDELASLRAAILRLDGVTRRDCLTAFNALTAALAPKPEGGHG